MLNCKSHGTIALAGKSAVRVQSKLMCTRQHVHTCSPTVSSSVACDIRQLCIFQFVVSKAIGLPLAPTIRRLWIRFSAVPLSCSNLGQVVHTELRLHYLLLVGVHRVQMTHMRR